MALGPYATFIVTSYALVAAVVLILIVWIAIDYRRQKARVPELEASALPRPSRDGARLFSRLPKDTGRRAGATNHKVSRDTARRFLGRYGNPFGIVGVDANGRGSIEWGVYGVPETFVVGREGTILYKMVGPVTPENIDSVLKVEIEKALK